MPIESGRYIISHAQYWNLAFLSDANDGTSLQGCLDQDVPGEEWNVKELQNGRYSIVNFGHKMSAGAVFQAQKGEHVVARERGSVWLIKEHDSGGKFTIATANDKLRWWLDENWPETPITLHDAPPSDPRCLWTFQKIGRTNATAFEATQEEVAVVNAELARKTAEVEVARGELAQARAAAAENAARREDAESKASRKEAEVEEARREAAQAKAQAAIRETQLEEAQRRESQLKADLRNNSAQLQTARQGMELAEAAVAGKAREVENLRREVVLLRRHYRP